jgi:hypothetical protein
MFMEIKIDNLSIIHVYYGDRTIDRSISSEKLEHI